MKLLDIITRNINQIQEKLNNFDKNTNNKLNFKIESNGSYIEFSFLGSGTYGNVLRVKNNTDDNSIVPKGESIVVKVMKQQSDEPEKCRKLKKKIDDIKKSNYQFKNLKLDLINKYILQIIDVRKSHDIDIIFMEYIDGYDLKEYVRENKFDENKLNTIILQTLIGIRIFNKFLNSSHRDLKLENLYYSKKTNSIKVIDFGFVCDIKDKDCLNRYQGTSKYIHMDMNKKHYKKKTLKSNINNKLNLDHSNLTNNSSIKTKRYNKNNFPNATSQDLFSILIIILKLYYYYNKKNNNKSGKVYSIIDEYDKSFDKNLSESYEKKRRYKNKKKLINNLLKCNREDFDIDLVYLVKKLLENYWDNKKYQFKIGLQESEAVSKFIYDSLIFSSLLCNNSKESISLVNEFRNLVRLV